MRMARCLRLGDGREELRDLVGAEDDGELRSAVLGETTSSTTHSLPRVTR